MTGPHKIQLINAKFKCFMETSKLQTWAHKAHKVFKPCK